jgi:hypothetical protein
MSKCPPLQCNESTNVRTRQKITAGGLARPVDDVISLLFLFLKKQKYAYKITFLSLCLYVSLINFWTPEPVFMKLGTYIMEPNPNSTA